jgi:hypothetical protein
MESNNKIGKLVDLKIEPYNQEGEQRIEARFQREGREDTQKYIFFVHESTLEDMREEARRLRQDVERRRVAKKTSLTSRRRLEAAEAIAKALCEDEEDLKGCDRNAQDEESPPLEMEAFAELLRGAESIWIQRAEKPQELDYIISVNKAMFIKVAGAEIRRLAEEWEFDIVEQMEQIAPGETITVRGTKFERVCKNPGEIERRFERVARRGKSIPIWKTPWKLDTEGIEMLGIKEMRVFGAAMHADKFGVIYDERYIKCLDIERFEKVCGIADWNAKIGKKHPVLYLSCESVEVAVCAIEERSARRRAQILAVAKEE